MLIVKNLIYCSFHLEIWNVWCFCENIWFFFFLSFVVFLVRLQPQAPQSTQFNATILWFLTLIVDCQNNWHDFFLGKLLLKMIWIPKCPCFILMSVWRHLYPMLILLLYIQWSIPFTIYGSWASHLANNVWLNERLADIVFGLAFIIK